MVRLLFLVLGNVGEHGLSFFFQKQKKFNLFLLIFG